MTQRAQAKDRRPRTASASREQLIDRIRETLSKSGYYVSEQHHLRSISFDIVARKDRQLVILKALCNIDSLSSNDAEQLKIISLTLDASPLVIGMHSSAADLEDGILYSRFGIPIISEDTFSEHMLNGIPPFIYAAPGGLYVRIDGEALRELRKKRGISLGALAEVAGVSRKAIQMYEGGMGAMVEIASRIEEFLDEPIVLSLDPLVFTAEMPEKFDPPEGSSGEILDMLREIGYLVVPTRKSPFDALAREEEILLLTGIGGEPKTIVRKARIVANISRITEKKSVMIIDEDSTIEEIDGTPLVSRDELRRVDHSEDLLDLILKREKRVRQ